MGFTGHATQAALGEHMGFTGQATQAALGEHMGLIGQATQAALGEHTRMAGMPPRQGPEHSARPALQVHTRGFTLHTVLVLAVSDYWF